MSVRQKGGAREANFSGFWYDELRSRMELYIEGDRILYFGATNGVTFESALTMGAGKALTADTGPIDRAALTEDALAVFDLPIRNWMAEDGAVLGIGEEAETFFVQDGSNQMYLQGEVSLSETEVSIIKTSFTLPESYVDAATLTLRIVVDVTGTGTLGTCTVDASVRKQDNDGAVGGDLVTTGAIAVTKTACAKDFTITPTGLASGDVLSIVVTTSIQESAGSAIQALLTKTQMLCDVKG